MIGKSKREVWRDVLLIVGTAAVFFLPSFATRDLWNPDEPRYMEVAREMVVLDDYLTPHLNGEVYPDKPPLFFWLAAGLFKAGLGYNSGRVVAALAAIGTALLVYFLARRIMPRSGPLLSALVTLTTVIFMTDFKRGVIDPLLTFLTTSAIYCGVRALQREETRFRLYWLLGYVAAGLAVLAKGPVGVIIPVLVVLAYGFATAKPIRKGGWIHLAGGALLVIVVAAWLGPALAKGGEGYAENVLLKQNLGRVRDSYSHQRPLYYYVVRMPALFLPWTLILVPAAIEAFRTWRRSRESAAALVLAWTVPVLFFFSLMSGKRTGYILPIAPAIGLLAGRYLGAGAEGSVKRTRLQVRLLGVTLAVVALAGILAPIAAAAGPTIGRLAYADDPELAGIVAAASVETLPWTLAGALLLCLALGVVWRQAAKHGPVGPACAGIVASIAVISLVADLAIAPIGNRFRSGRNFVRAAQPYIAQADRLFLYEHRFSGLYNLYTGQARIPMLKGPEALRRALSGPECVAVIGSDGPIFEALGDPPSLGRVAAETRVKARRMLLLTNWEADRGPGGGVRE